MHIIGPQRWARGQRWSIATRRSVNTCAALASYRYRYLDGWREKETRAAMVFGRCFEKLSVPIFVRKIALLRFSKNGMHTAMLPLNSAKESPGTVSSTR